MTKPEYRQFFENFSGKDELASPLGRGLTSAIEFKNLEKLPNGSIRGRQGLKICSQPMQVINTHKYTYLDSNNQVQEQLLGIATFDYTNYNKYLALVKYVEYDLTISYTGGNLWSYAVTNTSGNIVFTLVDNGVTVLTVNMGSGYSSSDTTLSTLAAAISAVANFSASVPKTAVVNGAQASVVAITVDAGHGFSIGDMTYFVDTKAANPYERIAEIVNTSATTITINTDSVYTNVTVTDNQIIGHGRFYAAILDLGTGSSGAASSQTISYGVWEPVRTLIDGLYLGEWQANRYHSLPSFENKRNCAYFSAPYLKSLSVSFDVQIGRINYNPGLWKYDGLRYFLSGNASDAGGSFFPTDSGAGTGVGAGTYRYTLSLRATDAQNNEVEFFMPRYADLTLAAAKNVNVNISDLDNAKREFNRIHAKFTAIGTTVNTFSVTSGHQFRVGDYVFFLDAVAANIAKRKVTAITLTTITVDGNPATVANGARIGNCTLRIWRSKTGAVTGYLALETPLHLPSGSETYSDTTADASLGIIKSSVEPINLQHPFPRGRAIAEHQGSLCVASGQTVYWEDADSPEFSPLAVSNTEVPSGVSGEISALIGVSDASLHAIKISSQYSLDGSLPSNDVEVSKVVENSFGVENPAAVKIVDTILIGVGKLGIFANKNNEFIKGFGKEFLNIFRNVDGYVENYMLRLSKAIVAHDPNKNWIHFFIPYEKRASVSSTNDYYTIDEYSRHLVYMISPTDDQPSCWSEFMYDKKQQGNAGFVTINNTFYQQSSLHVTGVGFSRAGLNGFLHKRLETESASDYLDNTLTYDWAFTSRWDDAGEPKISKFWNDFVLYQVQAAYFIDAFTVAFESYRDWNFTKVDSIRTSNLAFSASTDTEKLIQLDKGYKAQRRSFKLSGTVSKNPPIFSGYEYTVDNSTYKGDRMVKNE